MYNDKEDKIETIELNRIELKHINVGIIGLSSTSGIKQEIVPDDGEDLCIGTMEIGRTFMVFKS